MKIKIFPIVFAVLATALGCLYSVYNTDSHHWGFILGTALDFIQGKNLFTQIYIQYGAGEPLFFKLLGSLLPITFTSIGIITSFTYAMSLVVLFYGIMKISNALIAALIMTFVFMMHPYAIYPWPDYFSGFFLALSCFFLTREKDAKNHRLAYLAGIFLFVSFLFRSTYIMSFGAAMLAYGALALIFPKIREKKVLITISTFGLSTFAYFLFLYQNSELHLWFAQTIGAGGAQYGIGLAHLIAPLKEAFFPSTVINILFSILYYFGFYALLSLFLKGKRPSGIVIFLSLLGMAGLVQSLLLYEMFRLINACSPLIFVAAIILYEIFPRPENFWSEKKIVFLLAWYFSFFFLHFPHATSWFPFFDGRFAYHTNNIPVFKLHRFKSEVNDYYNGLSTLLCDGKSKIVNHTQDSMIPYLCPNQTNASALPFAMAIFKDENAPEILTNDELVVDQEPLQAVSPNIKLVELGKVDRPEDIRFTTKGTVKVFRVENNESH